MNTSLIPPPIYTLPPEILGEIFLRAYPDVIIGIRERPGLNRSLNICSLAAVCSLWRTVALSFPKLWSDILIHPHSLAPNISQNNSFAQSCAMLLDTCFARSSPRGVSFSLPQYTPSSFVARQFLEVVVLPRLINNRHRISKLNIEADLECILSSFDKKLEEGYELTSLKSLTLREWQSIDALQMCSFAANLPSLSVLRLLEVKGPYVLHWNFPWSQLTTFEWKSYPLPLDSYIETLKKMTNLEHLKVTTCCVTNFSNIRVELRYLKTLEVEVDARSLGKIIDPLVAPSLKSINIKEYRLAGVDDSFSTAPLIAMIQRSKCSIESLDVSGFNTKSVQNSLREVPHLRET